MNELLKLDQNKFGQLSSWDLSVVWRDQVDNCADYCKKEYARFVIDKLMRLFWTQNTPLAEHLKQRVITYFEWLPSNSVNWTITRSKKMKQYFLSESRLTFRQVSMMRILSLDGYLLGFKKLKEIAPAFNNSINLVKI